MNLKIGQYYQNLRIQRRCIWRHLELEQLHEAIRENGREQTKRAEVQEHSKQPAKKALRLKIKQNQLPLILTR